MKRIVLLSLTCALVIACQDQRSPTAAKPPSFQLLQGGHDHFFFLPPIVPQRTFTGTFNPALKPIVVICQLVVDANNIPLHCADTPPIDPGPVTADLAGQHYKVNWDTRQSGILSNLFYRIQVFASPNGVLLGFADVDPVSNGSQLKNVNTGEYIGLVDGRTLPIKFRIERGALTGSGNCTDCAEQAVGPAGGTVITNTSLAGVFFPQGALPRDVTVIIEATPPGAEQSCIPVNLTQFPGCYTFSTDPGPTTFNTSVTAAICVETEGLTTGQIQSLILYQLDVVGESDVVTPLENTPAAFLPCNSLARARPRGNGILGLALAGLDAIRRLVVPAPLNAAHLGVGGLTGSFSRIGWGLPPFISQVGGTDNQTAAPGSTVGTAPAVRLQNSLEQNVAGLPVKFKVKSGGGKIVLPNESLVESVIVTTGADGIAAVSGWQLGPTAGATNTLEASQVGALGSPLTFTATATGGVDLVTVNLTSTTLTIRSSEGQNFNVPYTASISNTTGTTLSVVFIQAYVDQGAAHRAANGSDVTCGPSVGDLPPGTCPFSFSVGASNIGGGTGILVQGSATAVFELRRFDSATQTETLLDTFTVPVTLVNPSP